MCDLYGPRLVSLEILESLFSNNTFLNPLSPQITPLIHYGQKLMREGISMKSELPNTKSTKPPKPPKTLIDIVRTENARDYSFCRVLCRWINRLLPRIHAFTFHDNPNGPFDDDEKRFLSYRRAKDTVLSTLVYWNAWWNLWAVEKQNDRDLELLRWLTCVHLESVCVANPIPAISCLASYSLRVSYDPLFLSNTFLLCLQEASTHLRPVDILNALFPYPAIDPTPFTDYMQRDIDILCDTLNRGEKNYPYISLDSVIQNTFLFRANRSRFDILIPKFLTQSLNDWHTYAITSLVHVMMRLLLRSSSSESMNILDRSLDGHPVTLNDLLRLDIDVWPAYLYWVKENEKRGFEQNSLDPKYGPFLFQMVQKCFITFGNDLRQRMVTVGTLRECDIGPSLHIALTSLGLEGTCQLMDSLMKELDVAWEKVQNISKICTKYIPFDPATDLLSRVKELWRNLRVADVFYLIHSPIPSECISYHFVPTLHALPLVLVESLNWMLPLSQSPLFDFVFTQLQAPKDYNLISLVCFEWNKLFTSLQNKSILFPQLQYIAQYLSFDELELLYSTTNGTVSEQNRWVIREVDRNMVTNIRMNVEKFLHLQNVIDIMNEIEGCLPYFRYWLKHPDTTEEVRSNISTLRTLLDQHPFVDQCLDGYTKFSVASEAIHPALLNVNKNLFEKILESRDLLVWLRTLQDDQDFTRGIEMAMGRSEMECPAELWVEEEGHAGRVNEGILSMLQSVRTYLYRLIYRKNDLFMNCNQFILEFLAYQQKYEPKILSHLDVCNEYRLALIELLSGGDETAAPDRLLRLLQPTSESFWICSTKKEYLRTQSTQSSVENLELNQIFSMEYVLFKKGKGAQKKFLTVSELEDFQSSVVLARTDQRGEETRTKIKDFVTSFGWMKSLSFHLLDLQRSGHFLYETLHEAIPLGTPPDILREKALNAQKLLQEWESDVLSCRMRYPMMNNFGMKLIGKLLNHLQEETNLLTSTSFMTLFSNMVYLTTTTLQSFTQLEELVTILQNIWHDLTRYLRKPFDNMPLKEILDLIGSVIQKTFAHLPPRCRRVEAKTTLINSFKITIDCGDVRLITVDSHEFVFQEVLSSFVQFKLLPERTNLLLCREQTSWEDVLLLLLRWRLAPSDEKTLFCVANGELLQNQIQQNCVSFILESLPHLPPPLLFICAPSKDSILISQFLSRRTVTIPISLEILRNIVGQIYVDHAKTFVSDYAGSGKSFQIRKGRTEFESYFHCPATAIDQFLDLVQQSATNAHQISHQQTLENGMKDDFIFHIDIYDTIGPQVISYLFELIFFEGFCNFSSDKVFYFNPQNTFFWIEVPNGMLKNQLLTTTLWPIQHVTPKEFFTSDNWMLLKGMGNHMFKGTRYDGTAMRKRTEGLRRANAYERLQYVCTVLSILKKEHGRFPYVFESGVQEPEQLVLSIRMSLSEEIAIPETEIEGIECYELLVEASRLPSTQVSLWCIWNFVNMVYWQLRDMHFPDSPLNQLCMPTADDSSEDKSESIESKQYVKGEIIQFILRTAREFATRQSSELNDNNNILGIHAQGFSRSDFNGKWSRRLFEHDSHPVYSTSGYRGHTFYMYYRSNEDHWVIDDVIASNGPVFSSSESSNMNSHWSTVSSWELNQNIRAVQTRHLGGYNGEAIKMSGFPDETENGTYLRQSPYDDINNHAHYIKSIEGSDVRRHLFFNSRENAWQICPVCTDDEGAFGLSVSLFKYDWNILPGDIIEKSVRITFIKVENVDSVGSREVVERGDEEKRLMQTKEESFRECIALEKLFEKTIRWRDSNHESLLFSNRNHIVSFLSMDPQKMRQQMHPRLLEFLEQNRINVGESLDELSARLFAIISLLMLFYHLNLFLKISYIDTMMFWVPSPKYIEKKKKWVP
jgi:hypothetical protein